jgi:hypothetical protein
MNAKWLVVGVGLGFGVYAGSMACGSKNVIGVGGSGGGTTVATTGPTTTGSTTSTMTGSTTSTMTGSTTSTMTGAGGATSSTTSTMTGAGGAATTTTSTGAGGECSTVGTLHAPTPGSTMNIFCPFAPTDAGDVYCTSMSQHCCETPEGNATPTSCEPIATACMTGSGYMDWQCQDPVADCPAATPVCCAPGASIGLGTPGCGNFAHEMKNTTCEATGACAGIIMCTSNAECPAATPTCTPFDKSGAQVGGCM